SYGSECNAGLVTRQCSIRSAPTKHESFPRPMEQPWAIGCPPTSGHAGRPASKQACSWGVPGASGRSAPARLTGCHDRAIVAECGGPGVEWRYVRAASLCHTRVVEPRAVVRPTGVVGATKENRRMQEVERVALRHRVALGVVGIVVVVLFTLLPLVLASLAFNVIGAPYTQVFSLIAGGTPSPAGQSHLHLEVVSLDPWQQLLTLRVSGHYVCPPGCTGQDQIVFLSLHSETDDAEGLPPSASLTLPQTSA